MVFCATLLLSKTAAIVLNMPKTLAMVSRAWRCRCNWDRSKIICTGLSDYLAFLCFPLLFRCISLCNGSAASNRRSGKGAIGGYWESDGTVEHMIAVRAPPVTATASLHSWYYARLPAILWRHTFVVKTFGICNSMQVHYMTISRNYPEASW